jgi:predicted amidohydrolase YtcJ
MKSLRLHTADAAASVGDGSIRGGLAPGMLADFAVFTVDISMPKCRLAAAQT